MKLAIKETNNNNESEDNREVGNTVEGSQSRSDSKLESHMRSNSESESKSRSESRNMWKSRPNSEIQGEKSRSVSQNKERSRPESQLDSSTRPNSKMVEFVDQPECADTIGNEVDSKTRPNSETDMKTQIKSRPTSLINSNTRPNSKMVEGNPSSISTSKSNSRPNSKILEDANTFSSQAKSRPVSNSDQNSGPIIDGEGVIEGIINGDDEVERMNNEGVNEPTSEDLIAENNEDVAKLVASGNMEQMAALVLNGDGHKLVGQKSENSELQSFLENVPVYMVRYFMLHYYVLKSLIAVQN